MNMLFAKASLASLALFATAAHARTMCTTVIVPSIYITIDGLTDEQFAQVTPVVTEAGKDIALDLVPIGHNYQVDSQKVGTYTVTLQGNGETLVSKDIAVTKGGCHVNTTRVDFTCSVQEVDQQSNDQTSADQSAPGQTAEVVCQ